MWIGGPYCPIFVKINNCVLTRIWLINGRTTEFLGDIRRAVLGAQILFCARTEKSLVSLKRHSPNAILSFIRIVLKPTQCKNFQRLFHFHFLVHTLFRDLAIRVYPPRFHFKSFSLHSSTCVILILGPFMASSGPSEGMILVNSVPGAHQHNTIATASG